MDRQRDCYDRLRDITETYICLGQVVDALRTLYVYRDLVDCELRECIELSRQNYLKDCRTWVNIRIGEVKKVL